VLKMLYGCLKGLFGVNTNIAWRLGFLAFCCIYRHILGLKKKIRLWDLAMGVVLVSI
jgi:hypothetical protein